MLFHSNKLYKHQIRIDQIRTDQIDHIVLRFLCLQCNISHHSSPHLCLITLTKKCTHKQSAHQKSQIQFKSNHGNSIAAGSAAQFAKGKQFRFDKKPFLHQIINQDCKCAISSTPSINRKPRAKARQRFSTNQIKNKLAVSQVRCLDSVEVEGLQFFIDSCMQNIYWRSHALECIADWLQNDRARCECVLLQHANTRLLINLFDDEQQTQMQLDKILPLFRKLLSCSSALVRALASRPAFAQSLARRLALRHCRNSIRINLLKILALLLEHHPRPIELVLTPGLLDVLVRLSNDKVNVVVVALAQQLAQAFKKAGQQTQK